MTPTDITVTGEDFVSVNEVAGVPVGTALELQTKCASAVIVQRKEGKPSATDDNGRVMKSVKNASSIYQIGAGSEEVWLRLNTDNFESEGKVGVYPAVEDVEYVYSPLSEFYDFAYFSPILIDESSAFSFRVKGLSNSPSPVYFLGSEFRGSSSGLSAVHFRGSDGRFRFERDDSSRDQVTINSISDGKEYLIIVRNKVSNVQYDVFSISNNGSLNIVESKDGSLPPSQSTFTCIGARRESGTIVSSSEGSIFGVTLAGESSWTMQSDNDNEFSITDYISSNDLIYSGSPSAITSENTVKTIAAEGL